MKHWRLGCWIRSTLIIYPWNGLMAPTSKLN
ncbi:hypothetical protein GLYMA_U031402v4 [Glycine max]|nr:hypothetical protein GLYMA_U031402v4 [Glycine max]